MATTFEMQRQDRNAESHHEESWLHYLAREARLALRWAVLIFGATTVLAMITFSFWAILPAMALLLSYVLLLIADSIESRTQRPGDPHDETAEDLERARQVQAVLDPKLVQKEKIEQVVERRSHRLVAGIIVGIAVAALLLAALVFGRDLAILGGFILFAYFLFVAAPIWLGWIEDDAEEAAHRVESRLEAEPSTASAGSDRGI